MQISKLLLLLSLFAITCSYAPLDKNEKGNVIYSFESGQMQCMSEIDPEGHTFVLYKSLNKNTTIGFTTLKGFSKKGCVLVVNMDVEEEPRICAGWINRQEVSVGIDPKPVEKITLSGRIVYKNDFITVMTDA